MKLELVSRIDRKSRLSILKLLLLALVIASTSCGRNKEDVVQNFRSDMKKFNDSSVVVFDKAILDLRDSHSNHKAIDRAMRTVLAFERQLYEKQEEFQKKANDAHMSIEEFGQVNRGVLDKTIQPAMQKYSVLKFSTMRGDGE